MKYDRQALAMRRLQCDNLDSDPIVWTNQKFIRWARSIDLGEYADNLKGKRLLFVGDSFQALILPSIIRKIRIHR